MEPILREVSVVTDLNDLFRRQAEWQKARAGLSWSEKLKLAEVLRDAALAMRASGRQTEKPDARKSRSE